MFVSDGGRIFCGAGSSIASGVMAVHMDAPHIDRHRVIVLDSSGDVHSFSAMNMTNENPFVADDFGARLKAAALRGFTGDTKIMEIAVGENGGVRVRMNNGIARELLERYDGSVAKTNEVKRCMRVTKHGFYTNKGMNFIKTADGDAGGVAPIMDDGVLYVIETNEADYRVTMRYNEANDSYDIYIEGYRLSGAHNAMPKYAFKRNGALHVYFDDGSLLNTQTGESFAVDTCGWITMWGNVPSRSFTAFSAEDESMSEKLPPAQASWYEQHGAWKNLSWAGIGGVVGATVGSQNKKVFSFKSQKSWKYPHIDSGFYAKSGKIYTNNGVFDITSATGSSLMQMLETSYAMIFPTGGVYEMTTVSNNNTYGTSPSVRDYQFGYAGNRWVNLSPADFIA